MNNASPISWESVHSAREGFREYRKSIKEIRVRVASVEDRKILYHHLSIPIRIYTPEGIGPYPMVVYFHGGGFVLGDLDSVDNLCRYLCKYSERIVISVDYRLAPENPYPAALEDALASIQWAHNHAGEINAIGTNIAIAGDSAGGNLAAQAAILLRDSKEISINSQWLFYPWLDFQLDSKAHELYGEGYNLTTEELEWYLSYYLPQYSDRSLPNVSPLLQNDLSELPDSIIITAQYDPLQNDGIQYAKALLDAGNAVDYTCCKTLTHSFLSMTGEIEEARDVLDQIAAKMKARNHKASLEIY
ncbi:hypothetical protein CHI07_10355 [Paenibacillus sp. 7884-2]|nr:hypothetical protein CHI07_10355 [Paenibacillus sp. 7884-2]